MKWLSGRFKCAFEGLFYAIKNDKSIALQCVFGIIAIVSAILLKCNEFEFLWVCLAVCLVICIEFLNSCIERVVDYISLERCDQAKRIKDMAATAVFITSVFAFIVAIVVLLPKLWGLL